MMNALSEPATTPRSVVVQLMPILLGVFVGYLVIGLAMPVIPLHVHNGLGLGTFVVGLVAGTQFAASLLSRFWSGNYADRLGGKRAMTLGLLIAAVAGFVYGLSVQWSSSPTTSILILLAGRAILGGAESFIVSGALVWGLTLVGQKNAGKVMSWVGTAMYVAFAAGAPAGTVLYGRYGFMSIAVATLLIPLVTLLFIGFHPSGEPTAFIRPSFRRVIGAVWLPGIGLALSSVGFGAITTFSVLLYRQHGWDQAWLSLTGVSVAFVVGRLFLGHLPDRIGGLKIALICVLIEATGQVLIWLAPWPALALLGAVLSGLGYSLVFPGFGVEAIRRAPAQSRGLATGAYTAFLDLALGLANPLLGLLAGITTLSVVFLISGLIVSLAAVIAVLLLKRASYRPT